MINGNLKCDSHLIWPIFRLCSWRNFLQSSNAKKINKIQILFMNWTKLIFECQANKTLFLSREKMVKMVEMANNGFIGYNGFFVVCLFFWLNVCLRILFGNNFGNCVNLQSCFFKYQNEKSVQVPICNWFCRLCCVDCRTNSVSHHIHFSWNPALFLESSISDTLLLDLFDLPIMITLQLFPFCIVFRFQIDFGVCMLFIQFHQCIETIVDVSLECRFDQWWIIAIANHFIRCWWFQHSCWLACLLCIWCSCNVQCSNATFIVVLTNISDCCFACGMVMSLQLLLLLPCALHLTIHVCNHLIFIESHFEPFGYNGCFFYVCRLHRIGFFPGYSIEQVQNQTQKNENCVVQLY